MAIPAGRYLVPDEFGAERPVTLGAPVYIGLRSVRPWDIEQVFAQPGVDARSAPASIRDELQGLHDAATAGGAATASGMSWLAADWCAAQRSVAARGGGSMRLPTRAEWLIAATWDPHSRRFERARALTPAPTESGAGDELVSRLGCRYASPPQAEWCADGPDDEARYVIGFAPDSAGAPERRVVESTFHVGNTTHKVAFRVAWSPP